MVRASLTAAMRTSNPSVIRMSARGPQSLVVGLIAVWLVAAACGSAPPSVAPVTPQPTPLITPDPHLVAPVDADAVFRAIVGAGLPIFGNNAAAGRDPVKTINATYRGWPMQISQYRSGQSLAHAKPWNDQDRPGRGEPPVAIIGLNILVEWGPTTHGRPRALDEAQILAMNEFLQMLDPYVGPLVVRTTSQLRVPVATPTATPDPPVSTPASAVPSKPPTASP